MVKLTKTDGRKALQTASLVMLVIMVTSPALADPTNISGGLNSITSWVKTAAVPVGILAIMGAGFAKLAGRLDWGRFFAVLVGIGIIFGATQIVSWMSAGASGF